MSRSTSFSSLPQSVDSSAREGVWRMVAAMLLSGTIGIFVLESGLSVELVVLLRCVLGAAALGLWLSVRQQWVSVSRTDVVWMAGGGLALVVNWVALFHAYAYAGIAIATVVYHVQPFMLVLASALSGEAIGWRRVPWMLLALAGVVLSSGLLEDAHAMPGIASPGPPLLGVLLALSAAALYTLTVMATRRVKHVPPAQAAMLQMTSGGVMLALWIVPMLLQGALSVQVRDVSVPQSVLCMLVLGFVHTALMYVWMYGAFQRLGAGAIAMLSFIYPAVALAVDLAWFGARPGALQWVGMGCIVVAIAGYRHSEWRAAA